MNVKVIFSKNSQPDIAKAAVAERLCQAAFLCIKLPDYIEVHFANLGPSVYGETMLKPGINRSITVNLDLSVNEIIYPITHELIHLSQLYEGKLAVGGRGIYVWEGKTYKVDTSKISHKEFEGLNLGGRFYCYPDLK